MDTGAARQPARARGAAASLGYVLGVQNYVSPAAVPVDAAYALPSWGATVV
jgi:hypothetical protein